MSDLLENPAEGCFFCEPEAWRTIFRGQWTQILAGAGPLCPGYAILAPLAHTNTVAELVGTESAEFFALYEILLRALDNHYGPGYTAYEHGRIGSCAILEAKQDFSSYCHHAHRVVLPRRTEILARIQPRFRDTVTLDRSASLLQLAGTPYVFYESDRLSSPTTRVALVGSDDLPSQFMRRALTDELRTGRNWNWIHDLRVGEMIRTTSLLAGEFVGIMIEDDNDDAVIGLEGFHGDTTITLDGLSSVGKTTLATELGRRLQLPVMDSGLVFRIMAATLIGGNSLGSTDWLAEQVTSQARVPRLRDREVSRRASELASDPSSRRIYEEVTRTLVQRWRPCILTGRDTWKIVEGARIHFVVEADFETRLRRRLLELARVEGQTIDIGRLAQTMELEDQRDKSKLPPADSATMVRLNNGRRRLLASAREAIESLRSVA